MKEERETIFAQYLKTLMEEHDPPMGIRELAAALDITYEHVRRMVRGANLPSKILHREIARTFKVALSEVDRKAKEDKFQREYGEGSPVPLFDPEVEAIAKAWTLFSEEQKAEMMSLLKKLLHDSNRAAKRKTK
jgi:hypothetical protein